MISVNQADQIIRAHQRHYGTEAVPLLQAPGRVLAEEIIADRDLPPFNRVAMDGIAIRQEDFSHGQKTFSIAGVIGAGEDAPTVLAEHCCYEIMTGAALPPSADTIVPYEQLEINAGVATITHDTVNKGQHIHVQGKDKRAGEVLVPAGQLIGPIEISVAASAGKTHLLVNKLPRVVIFSSGNELVELAATPLPYQIRRSNSYAIHTALQRYGLDAAISHLPDDLEVITLELQKATANYDVILLSGGISMGKFDYIPQALASVGVTQQFHKVRQKPGKPFWFGTFGEKGVVFALPGNPVSTFLCLLRYAVPWLETSLGFPPKPFQYAALGSDFRFEAPLQYFMQVKLRQDEKGTTIASPIANNGSGDYASLLEADAFLELPAEQTVFAAGALFHIWGT